MLELGFVWAAVTVVVGLAWIGAVGLALILGALVTWLLVPHWLVDRLLVPRGWHRAAWFVARTDVRGDRALWPRLMAARAVARAGAPAAAVAWLDARLEAAIRAIAGAHVHGAGAPRTGHTINARFDGVRGETLVMALDLVGVDASAAAACSSGSTRPAPTPPPPPRAPS